MEGVDPKPLSPGGYSHAAVPEPYRILGLKLKPFCLGHYLLMKRFDCAFVSPGEKRAGLPDLILGLLICSMGYLDFLTFIESKGFEREISRWSHKVSPFPWLGKFPFIGKWWRSKYSFNIVEKMGLFKAYVSNSSRQPSIWIEDDSEPSNSHWSQSVFQVLRSHCGYSAEQALALPLTQAFSDFYKYAESLGVITFMSDEEVAAMAAGDVENVGSMGASGAWSDKGSGSEFDKGSDKASDEDLGGGNGS